MIARAAAALAACAALAGAASAHPHIWITAKYDVALGDDGKVGAISVAWTFDEFYSAFMVDGLELDAEGRVKPDGLAGLASETIASLAEVGYFVFVKADGQEVKVGAPDTYSFGYEGGLLTLRFVAPLATPVDPRAQALEFSGFDPSYYTEIRIAEPADVTVEGGCRAEVQEPQKEFRTLTGIGEDQWQSDDRYMGAGAWFAQPVKIAC